MNVKAYPPAWAHNEAVRAAAGRWQRCGLLTAAQQAAIEAAHPLAYYRPLLFLRIGLFIATLLASSSVLGGVVSGSGFLLGPLGYGVVVLLSAGLVLELVIKRGRHYRSGVDNALLYNALGAWIFLVLYTYFELLPPSSGGNVLTGPLTGWLLWLAVLALLLASLLAALLRYADPVVAVLAFGTALALLVSALFPLQLLLPFGLLGAAASLLFGLEKLPARPDYFYYRSSILVLRTLALALFYLGGNYLIVREGNAELLGATAPGGGSPQIPFAALFGVFTAGIPLLYVFFGLRRHDRLLLVMGLLAGAFSLFTLRFYRAALPPEIAATAGGALLIIFSLSMLRYLRTPRHGLTAQADAAAPPFNLETLVVAQTAHAPAAPEAGFEFGGGHSGGGGAEGNY